MRYVCVEYMCRDILDNSDARHSNYHSAPHYRTTTGQAVHQNGLCESSLSLLCTDRLGLVA